jgi:hypothetical protein
LEEYASDEEVKGTEVDGLNMTFRHLIQKPATRVFTNSCTMSKPSRFPIHLAMIIAEILSFLTFDRRRRGRPSIG